MVEVGVVVFEGVCRSWLRLVSHDRRIVAVVIATLHRPSQDPTASEKKNRPEEVQVGRLYIVI